MGFSSQWGTVSEGQRFLWPWQLHLWGRTFNWEQLNCSMFEKDPVWNLYLRMQCSVEQATLTLPFWCWTSLAHSPLLRYNNCPALSQSEVWRQSSAFGTSQGTVESSFRNDNPRSSVFSSKQGHYLGSSLPSIQHAVWSSAGLFQTVVSPTSSVVVHLQLLCHGAMLELAHD